MHRFTIVQCSSVFVPQQRPREDAGTGELCCLQQTRQTQQCEQESAVPCGVLSSVSLDLSLARSAPLSSLCLSLCLSLALSHSRSLSPIFLSVSISFSLFLSLSLSLFLSLSLSLLSQYGREHAPEREIILKSDLGVFRFLCFLLLLMFFFGFQGVY